VLALGRILLQHLLSNGVEGHTIPGCIQGLKIRRESRRDRSGPRLEIGDFLIQNLKILKIQKIIENM
jgi:hypothetical protein